MEFTIQVNVSKESLPHNNGWKQSNGPNGHGGAVALAAMPAVVEQVRSNGRGAYWLHVRMQSRLAAGGLRVLSDEGGSDPESLKVAMMALSAVPLACGGNRWAVLGKMGEFTEYDPADYQAVGRFCAEHFIDRLVCVGPQAMHYAAGAIEQGMDEEGVQVFHGPSQALSFLRENVDQGDVMLVKGTDGMEEVLDGLCAA